MLHRRRHRPEMNIIYASGSDKEVDAFALWTEQERGEREEQKEEEKICQQIPQIKLGEKELS